LSEDGYRLLAALLTDLLFVGLAGSIDLAGPTAVQILDPSGRPRIPTYSPVEIWRCGNSSFCLGCRTFLTKPENLEDGPSFSTVGISNPVSDLETPETVYGLDVGALSAAFESRFGIHYTSVLVRSFPSAELVLAG
jgi:hypothetical protein